MNLLILPAVLGALCQAPDLSADAELQDLLARAAASRQPHLIALSERMTQIIDFAPPADPAGFKRGALRVFKHADTRKRSVVQLYLWLTQQHVVQDIIASEGATASILVDGSRKDWPATALIDYPKHTTGRKLKSFGVARGDGLYLMFETPYKVADEPKLVYGIDISTLANHFTMVDYTVRITNLETRAYDAEGKEIDAPPDRRVKIRPGARTFEVWIPRDNIKQDMRSIAVRGVLYGPGDQRLVQTPWVACPTGPVTAPVELLIEFAAHKDLPAGSSLPLAVALQEGLLLARCHPDLADTVRAHSREWYDIAMDLDARADLGSFKPPGQLAPAELLAWACRYDGHASLMTEQDYLFHVPEPETLRELSVSARRKGLTRNGDVSAVLARVTDELADFKIYDWPSSAARTQGADFVDDRPDAYIERGDKKLLSYRDVGINDLNRQYQVGKPLKGTRRQAVAFQRAITQALGLPTLSARYDAGPVSRTFTLSFDGHKKKWLAAGAEQLPSTHPQLLFSWTKPWTRPERFPFRYANAAELPDGHFRGLLDAHGAEQPLKRLSALLDKGIPAKMVDNTILPLDP